MIKTQLHSYIDAIQKADQYIAQLEEGEVPGDIANFLKKELHEVTPEVLHGKSMTQRSEELHQLIKNIEDCIEQESDFLSKLKQAVDDPSHVI